MTGHMCACGHPALVHHIPPGKTHRTWCTTYNKAGRCPCPRYDETEDAE